MNSIPMEMIPRRIMMRAIQSLAPTFCSTMLLGTSKKNQPMKKIPAPIEYTVSLKCSSVDIVQRGRQPRNDKFFATYAAGGITP